MGQENTQIRERARVCASGGVTSSVVSAELDRAARLMNEAPKENHPRAFTTQEFADRVGKSRQSVIKKLKKMEKLGQVAGGFKVSRWVESRNCHVKYPGWELVEGASD